MHHTTLNEKNRHLDIYSNPRNNTQINIRIFTTTVNGELIYIHDLYLKNVNTIANSQSPRHDVFYTITCLLYLSHFPDTNPPPDLVQLINFKALN